MRLYYGRASLGRIQGFVRLFRWGANAAGPLVAGLAYDLTGSYQAAFIVFGLTRAFSAVLMVFARPPAPCPEGLVAEGLNLARPGVSLGVWSAPLAPGAYTGCWAPLSIS